MSHLLLIGLRARVAVTVFEPLSAPLVGRMWARDRLSVFVELIILVAFWVAAVEVCAVIVLTCDLDELCLLEPGRASDD